jgi:alpha-glucosidase
MKESLGECNLTYNPEVREWWAGLFKELILHWSKGVWNDI